MLGLAEHDIAGTPLWVDTGAEQLVIPLRTSDAVRRVSPRPDLMTRHGSNGTRAMAYVFAREGDQVLARFFFPKQGAIAEDPGTGSACANLGGWLIATGAQLPQQLTIRQGEAVGRPCLLGLARGGRPGDPGERPRRRAWTRDPAPARRWAGGVTAGYKPAPCRRQQRRRILRRGQDTGAGGRCHPPKEATMHKRTTPTLAAFAAPEGAGRSPGPYHRD